MIELIGFDADDTLWHNETHFDEAINKYYDILKEYGTKEEIDEEFKSIEINNIQYFGYGIKGFTLSMIEAAINISKNLIDTNLILQIIGIAKLMYKKDLILLTHVDNVLSQLKEKYKLILITKGDLHDQQEKINRSGLKHYFYKTFIIAEKNPQSYQSILKELNFHPEQFLMVGNSLKSDILPPLDIGSHVIHIPYEVTSFLEMVDESFLYNKEYHQLSSIKELAQAIEKYFL